MFSLASSGMCGSLTCIGAEVVHGAISFVIPHHLAASILNHSSRVNALQIIIALSIHNFDDLCLLTTQT